MPCTLPYPNLPSKHASATTSSPSPLYCTLCLTSRLVRARPKGNLTTLARRHHSIHVGALLMRPLCPKKGCARFGKVYLIKILFGGVCAEPVEAVKTLNLNTEDTRKQTHAIIAAVLGREQRPRKYPCQAAPGCVSGVITRTAAAS